MHFHIFTESMQLNESIKCQTIVYNREWIANSFLMYTNPDLTYN